MGNMLSNPTTIYCDGVFDLFHHGHVKHFQTLKGLHGGNVKLIVGVISNRETKTYKDAPVMNETIRSRLVGLCKYVDECIPNSPLYLTKKFITEHNIDYVYHAFANPEDSNKQDDFFKVPKEMGIFKTIPYVKGVSSTEIKESYDWKYVWQKKGTVDTKDLRLLSGYEGTDFDPESAWKRIVKESNTEEKDSVLEVGCGAGYVAQHITKTNPDYVGLDQSTSLVNKHLDILGNTVIVGEAGVLPFKDNSFDHVLCIGVFQYFPSKEYALQTLKELERVSRRSVYVGNVRFKSHDNKPKKHLYKGPVQHFIITPEEFPAGYVKTDAFYDPDNYFNMMLKI